MPALYSFWLVPPAGSPARERTQAMIDKLAEKHQSPSFTPHVTLAGGFRSLKKSLTADSSAEAASTSTSDAALAARALAASHAAFARPLRVTLERVATGSTYHRCVYALARETPELGAAAAAACEAALGVEAAAASSADEAATDPPRAPFKPDDVYMPHLSLLYSTDARAKDEAEREASSAFGGSRGCHRRRTDDGRWESMEGGEGEGEGPEEPGTENSETSWLSSEIEVWVTDGEVETWRLEARVPFGGGEEEAG